MNSYSPQIVWFLSEEVRIKAENILLDALKTGNTDMSVIEGLAEFGSQKAVPLLKILLPYTDSKNTMRVKYPSDIIEVCETL